MAEGLAGFRAYGFRASFYETFSPLSSIGERLTARSRALGFRLLGARFGAEASTLHLEMLYPKPTPRSPNAIDF